VILILLTMVIVPPLAGFYSYFSGVPLHLLASSKKEENETAASSAPPSVKLVPGQAHTLEVSDEVRAVLGIKNGEHDSVAIAQPPTTMRPLELPGSTAFDPARLARIRARFAPARVVEVAHITAWDAHHKTGRTEIRELRNGDAVSRGDLLGVFYSVDVGTRKNDLLDALVQLQLDQEILDEFEKNRYAIPQVTYLNQRSTVWHDRNAINKALNNLKLWDIPQNEIDALHAEAKKIATDKNAWFKTPEGRWVKGQKQAAKQATSGSLDLEKEKEDPWGRVTLTAPFDGVLVERNVHEGEMIVDNTVNLFQIADVRRLLVIASCPEDALPTLEALHPSEREWTVKTVGANPITGLAGAIDEIGYLIDPNQHTAVIKGYINNPGNLIRAGQYVRATVSIPPPKGVVEIPSDAVVDDGRQALVFVQTKSATHRFTMRRVHVTHRFQDTVFVRSTPTPKEEQLTELEAKQEAEEGLLPKEALRPDERVLLSGTLELKAVLADLEAKAQPKNEPKPPQAKTNKS
jgi:cobalt-zinc-cadmium efflux system membrane fusion protein